MQFQSVSEPGISNLTVSERHNGNGQSGWQILIRVSLIAGLEYVEWKVEWKMEGTNTVAANSGNWHCEI